MGERHTKVRGFQILNDSVKEEDLQIYNAPSVGKILGYTANGMEWLDNPTLSIIYGASSTYLRIGDANTTSHSLASEDDLMITGKLEVDGYAYFDNYVGIGITTPSCPLDISRDTDGTVLNAQNNYASFTGIAMTINTARSASSSFDLFRLNSDAVTQVRVRGDGMMYIKGNVGIGTNTPSCTLDVVGAERIQTNGRTWLYLNNTTGTQEANSIAFQKNGTTAWEIASDSPTNGTHDIYIYDSINTIYPFRIDNGGIVTFANQSGCSVYGSATSQNFSAATYTKVAFDTEEYDIKSEYDKDTNYRFTATRAGIYSIKLQLYVHTNASGDLVSIFIYKNGVAAHRTFYRNNHAVGDTQSIVLTKDMSLSANDYIEFYIYSSNSGYIQMSTISSASFATISKIA